MKKILILIPHFFPGYRSGGPQQSIKNLIDIYGGNKAEFYIYTQNYDLGCEEPYENIEENKWLDFGNSKIMYVNRKMYFGKKLEELYNSFEIIYSCGLFERITIKLLNIHKKYKKNKKVYIAPMGVFSKEALKIKWFKKIPFLVIFRFFGMFNKIIWSFTSQQELKDANKYIGNIKNYIICEDLPRKVDFEKYLDRNKYNKTNESDLNIIFLSRICLTKNLLYCIKILKNISNLKIKFDIYGIIEDKKYWELCTDNIKEMPSNIIVNYCGELHPEETVEKFSKYDVFLFPTKGENYGHVIYEAMAGGCIPIISDKTPWNDIKNEQCGEVVVLEDINGFITSIEKYAKDKDLCKNTKINAINYAKKKYLNSVLDSGYLKIFEDY